MELSIALDRYDRHFPFFDGTVATPKGVSLKVFQIGQTVVLRDGEFRHERMLHDGEFDVCEVSLSSYLMAKDRGLDITAVPVFPRRLFSPGLFYARADAGISCPRDLIGRRVAINSFQTTLSVLARGDLTKEYGVPWEEIVWCVVNDEKVAFRTKPGVVIESLGVGANIVRALAEGRIDAFVHPHPPPTVFEGETGARSLFADSAGEELRYFRKTGYIPVMHVVAIRQSLVRSHPDIPQMVMDMFRSAKCISRSYFDDPNWSQLAWGRKYLESESRLFGTDIWPIGLKSNATNLSNFIDYMLDQELISRRLDVAELFPSSALDS